ncbi:RNA-binding protein Torus / ZC3H31 [Leishmania donovani]|uniref:Zinc_finger_protein_family_member_putative/GeneDB:LmjF.36.0740 n=2 Tax=Leishmania donovani TaxID=5661 RepID=A0A6J8FSI8_LEIDO|nr:RNA-binding protein Torus / ZC3H31 [Leishmania donovani]VDZ49264.1 zinc_finger_protein_family_member_putative/GeneDB:LmjF.36.0740 [Leishmania donovani]
MFPMDIANSGNQQMVYRNNQPPQQRQQHQMPQHHLQQQHHQMPQQQMFPSQYGYQQQPYLAYPSTAGPNAGKGAMDFIPSQQYMPQQQMFPYGYTQQHQSPLNQQFFPSVMAPQTQPPPPPMRYNQQGNSNSTNQYMGGHAGGHPRYHGGRGRGGMHSGYGGQFHRQVHNNYFYNQQHHYSSNNAVPEKTPTVHLIHPETKKIISIKLNRIYSTMADIRPQLHQQSHSNGASASNVPSVIEDSKSEKTSKNERPKEKNDSSLAPKFDPKTTKLVLCLSFLCPKGCMHGSGCDKVHIAGLEYTWPQVEAKEVKKEGKKAYSAGFFVHCYDPTLTRYYKVPSGSVYVTKGSAEYVNMFNDHGDNFKMKFKLCAPILEGAECEKGEECEDIHCSVSDLEAVRENSANATHINNIEAMADVPRLPADMTVRVFNQNSFDTWRDYPGGNLLITEGAKAYQKQYEQEMNSVPTRKRMQHCAHFRLKDMCRLGESCRFLHVLPTEQELKERKDAEAAEAAAQAAAKAMEGVAGEGIMKSDEKDAGVAIE